jgi:hypothetical protein
MGRRQICGGRHHGEQAEQARDQLRQVVGFSAPMRSKLERLKNSNDFQ